MRKDERVVFVQPEGEKVKGGGNLATDFSCLQGGYREDRLFSDTYNKRMRGNRHQLQQWKF